MQTSPLGFLVVPGIHGSDDEHWQSRWQEAWAGRSRRIEPSSWAEPDLDDWVEAVDIASHRLREDGYERIVVVAHSLGCWASAEWILRTRPGDTWAFMVAVPDEGSSSFPRSAAPSFTGLATEPLGVPALVVASDDDPYCSAERAASLASGWGAAWTTVGRRGHLNSQSGLDDWREGRHLLNALLETRPDR